MSSSWGKSWLKSWLNSWGKTDEGRSGWFRLWLAKAQEKANAERDAEKNPKAPEVFAQAEVAPKVLPKLAAARKKSKVARKDHPVEVPADLPRYVLPARVVQYPELALPDFSVSVYQKMRDAANQEQYRQHKRRREEEALILLLAA